MGLDNIPHSYPCQTEQTAIYRDGKIDCAATIAAGSCPWNRDFEKSGLEDSSIIRGILGAPCWYRGKAGNADLALLNDFGYKAPDSGFYGPEGDHLENIGGPALSPEYCLELANWMANHAEVFTALVILIFERQVQDHKDVYKLDEFKTRIDTYHYAIWWLRWVARRCDGADAWY